MGSLALPEMSSKITRMCCCPRTVTGRRLPAVRMPLMATLPVLHVGYNTGWSLLPHAVEGSRLIATDTRVD